MTFSEQEIKDLLKAWIVISFAFAFVLGGTSGLLRNFLLSGLTVGVAFLFHELAHKFVAQRFGCWAEFRAFDAGLALAVLTAIVTTFGKGGFVFAAPGAVVIEGLITSEESGKIAAFGPLTNIVLAIFYLFLTIFLPTSLPFYRFAIEVFSFGVTVNSSLAFFNLLPIFQLDGLKIFFWNRTVWGLLLAFATFLTFMF